MENTIKKLSEEKIRERLLHLLTNTHKFILSKALENPDILYTPESINSLPTKELLQLSAQTEYLLKAVAIINIEELQKDLSSFINDLEKRNLN